MLNEKGDADAVPFFKHAVEQDPNFALAYLSMGASFINMGENAQAIANIRKAFELRANVSEREKLSIAGLYYANVTGQTQQAIDTYLLWAQTYPADVTPHVDIAFCYADLGRFEEAVAESREALRIDPGDTFARSNLSINLINLNRFDEAKQVNREFFERKMDGAFVRFRIYQLAFIEGDTAEMAKQVAWSRGNPYNESAFEAFEMWTSAYAGQLAESRRHARASVDLAMRGGVVGAAALWQGGAAWTEAEMGEPLIALANARAAAASAGSWHSRIFALIVFSKAGEIARAQNTEESLRKDFPLDTLVNSYWIPAAHSVAAFHRGDAKAAINALRPAATLRICRPAMVRHVRTLPSRSGASPCQPAGRRCRRVSEIVGSLRRGHQLSHWRTRAPRLGAQLRPGWRKRKSPHRLRKFIEVAEGCRRRFHAAAASRIRIRKTKPAAQHNAIANSFGRLT